MARQRRGHGQGSNARQRKDGLWEVRITVDGKQKSLYGHSRKEVNDKLKEAQVAIAQGRRVGGRSQTLGQWLTQWLEGHRLTVKPLTVRAYTVNVKRFSQELGHIRLDRLSRSDVQVCYNRLSAQGLAPQTIKQAHLLLHKALEDALDAELLDRNVTDRAKLPSVRAQETERCTLTADQMVTLWQSTEGERFHALWVLLGSTGLRIGEALGLRWSDIDFGTRTLRVERTAQRHTGAGIVDISTKSRQSRRSVPLGDTAIAALQAEAERQRFRGTAGGLVFASQSGAHVGSELVWRHLRAATRAAGLPDIRVHDLRHSAATIAMEEGMHPSVVAALLGHSSTALTNDTYSHVSVTLSREAATALDRRFVAASEALSG